MTPEQAIHRCREASVALLARNLGPAGILAATPGRRANARGYHAVFARDAGLCALGMALSGDDALERAAVTALLTLGAHQARNGQIPKFVDPSHGESDFWYVGCIDATLWWLLAVEFLDQRPVHRGIRTELERSIAAALQWLECQEHPRFGLLQQNEASDWADIMPRSGFVLYTNALWYRVKHLFALPGLATTRRNFEHLFHPFSADVAEYRRARLLAHYARNQARNRDFYLSFVNFSFCGDEGDVLGNLIAILLGPAGDARARAVLRALERAAVHVPYPVRVVCDPIGPDEPLWRPYMARHRQNLEWQYHNGGIWPFVGALWACALAELGDRARAEAELVKVAHANALDDWAFCEWLHGRTLEPLGMRGQSWNAAAFLIALASLERPVLKQWRRH
jgi:hypothetical protein